MATHVVLWDPFVRTFHWSLAVAFLACRFATEAGDPPHAWLGYIAAGLVAMRVVWGFLATGAARWTEFWPTFSRLADHVRELRHGHPHRALGHSPIGALVMIGMMAGIVALGVTGYAMEEIDYFWGDERLHLLHDWLSNAVTALAAVHVAAAIVQSLWIRENLPMSMITGKRRAEPADGDLRNTPFRS
jgi:cytochrome b